MEKVFLISIKTIKESTVIPDNLGEQVIQQAISTAQDIDLQEIIGTKLLVKLCDMVKDGSIKDDELYKNLLDEYISPFLSMKVLANVQVPLYSKTRNLGVVNTTDTNVNTVNFNEVSKLEQYYNNKAQFYSTRLSKYLCNNHTKFPEYTHCNNEGFGARKTFYIPTSLN